MIPCFNISYSFRVEMISFLTGSFLSGCVFLHFHIHLNSKEKNMCCGEIEIAQGYVLERASFKISSTWYKYYSNSNKYWCLLQKLYKQAEMGLKKYFAVFWNQMLIFLFNQWTRSKICSNIFLRCKGTILTNRFRCLNMT